MQERQSVKSGTVTWINIANASEKDIEYLRRKFKFDLEDLAEANPHREIQRPKILFRPSYYFIVLIFPTYNQSTREIVATELDIFVTPDHIITIPNNRLNPLNDFFILLQSDSEVRDSVMGTHSGKFLYELLTRLYKAQFPLLDSFSVSINMLEKNVFAKKERALIEEILHLKLNITYFKKIMQAHKATLREFMNDSGNKKSMYWEKSDKLVVYATELINYTKNIWDVLNNYHETIAALEETNNTLLSFKLNDTIKTLTVFSVILLPLTLLVGIFGMNTIATPLVQDPNGFWYIITILAVSALVLYSYFKRKGWV